MGIRLVSCIKEVLVICVRLITLTLLFVTFCGRLGETWIDDLYLTKYGALHTVRYSHLAFDYIM